MNIKNYGQRLQQKWMTKECVTGQTVENTQPSILQRLLQAIKSVRKNFFGYIQIFGLCFFFSFSFFVFFFSLKFFLYLFLSSRSFFFFPFFWILQNLLRFFILLLCFCLCFSHLYKKKTKELFLLNLRKNILKISSSPFISCRFFVFVLLLLLVF